MVRWRWRQYVPVSAGATADPPASAPPDEEVVAADDAKRTEAPELQLSQSHDWALEQYKTLRQESLQSQSVQHTSLQWGLAITASSIAAGLLIASKGLTDSSALFGVELVLFGVAVPIFLLGSCLSWLGEVRRMMRTGIYVRWIENQVEVDLERMSPKTNFSGVSYLKWEHALAGLPSAPVRVGGRDWEGYLGCAIVYGGGELVSLAIWLTIALSQQTTILGFEVAPSLLVAYAIGMLTLIGLTILGVATKRVRSLAKVLGYNLSETVQVRDPAPETQQEVTPLDGNRGGL